ncbi:CehA/McbA family metallohydrolase [Streptomyces bungoensis]|uniref:CehA/McbA family metallohydrolase n=1 Tax=Streptomyces bungoensis TaxID=285568 RepID=UPI001428B651
MTPPVRHGRGRPGGRCAWPCGWPPAAGAPTVDRVTTLRGTLPPGCPDYVHLPFEVPSGTAELKVSYTYDRPSVPAGTPGNALDIGLFDERGAEAGGAGFRGWSGGARGGFFVRTDDATPGYLPGPLNPGTWYVVLGPYTVAPQGLSYEVTVTLVPGAAGEAPAPVYPPERVPGRGRDWYRGDCHLHSWHSDGRRTPAGIAAAARAAGLDFVNSSDHNTFASHAHWADAAGGDLLVLLGEEVTTRNGHVLAVGTDPGTFVDWRYRARDGRWAHAAREIRRGGGLVVPAHPYADCLGCSWKFGFAEADAVEVWNGVWTPDDEVALAAWDGMLAASVRGDGAWLPAMGGSDAHRAPDVVGHPQTVVLAEELSRRAVLAGLRAGRSYVAESKAVALDLTVSADSGERAGPGERLTVDAGTPVTVRLDVSGAPRCSARLVTDQGVVLRGGPLPVSGAGVVRWSTTAARAAYVRAELRHETALGPVPGAMAAFTNPVFLGAAGGA